MKEAMRRRLGERAPNERSIREITHVISHAGDRIRDRATDPTHNLNA
jgi:hypothetical protein